MRNQKTSRESDMLSMRDLRTLLRITLGDDQRRLLRAATWALIAMGAISVTAFFLILLKITGKIEREFADRVVPALFGLFVVAGVVFFEVVKVAGEQRSRARIER